MTDIESPNNQFSKVKLDIYEGPLDLLLNLIRENNLNIHDLSLTEVTGQYLEHVELLQEFDFDNIGDYLVIAAELARLKSRSLLPEDEKEELIDEPEMDLVQMLKEYKKYRALSEELSKRKILGRDTFKKHFDSTLTSSTLWEVQKTDIWRLITAVKNVLQHKNYKEVPDIELDEESIDPDIVKRELLNLFKIKNRLSFKEIFNPNIDKSNIITRFLIILDMIKDGQINIDVGDQSQIIFTRKDGQNG
ncbi:segregation/condensation protein A [bacterium]|nr:segregation/condensation protein A [bacterium]MBT3850471.1 segregation/condensation protein A [bacterium]MBT4434937.1 segregation/condensation protein A [bacterium]